MVKKTKKGTVMVFGVFDLLHQGHLAMLKEAKTYGNKLIAVLATDANAEKEKGKKPIQDQQTRANAIKPYVTKVIIGDENDYLLPLKREKPDIICL
ncbi:MAG: adenylyltransferase/cytidyltransferase family protein, partial [Candidatus Woesearchaeota archaeon]